MSRPRLTLLIPSPLPDTQTDIIDPLSAILSATAAIRTLASPLIPSTPSKPGIPTPPSPSEQNTPGLEHANAEHLLPTLHQRAVVLLRVSFEEMERGWCEEEVDGIGVQAGEDCGIDEDNNVEGEDRDDYPGVIVSESSIDGECFPSHTESPIRTGDEIPSNFKPLIPPKAYSLDNEDNEGQTSTGQEFSSDSTKQEHKCPSVEHQENIPTSPVGTNPESQKHTQKSLAEEPEQLTDPWPAPDPAYEEVSAAYDSDFSDSSSIYSQPTSPTPSPGPSPTTSPYRASSAFALESTLDVDADHEPDDAPEDVGLHSQSQSPRSSSPAPSPGSTDGRVGGDADTGEVSESAGHDDASSDTDTHLPIHTPPASPPITDQTPPASGHQTPSSSGNSTSSGSTPSLSSAPAAALQTLIFYGAKSRSRRFGRRKKVYTPLPSSSSSSSLEGEDGGDGGADEHEGMPPGWSVAEYEGFVAECRGFVEWLARRIFEEGRDEYKWYDEDGENGEDAWRVMEMEMLA